uniref:UDP-glucuronosyltransferase 2A2-like n=1 Tax=Solea senegalensis TaxID=28829 RepID=UPI001CD85886|nr:UDP-glucuronosyltransferase 2A2-like [Solea senegalensis]
MYKTTFIALAVLLCSSFLVNGGKILVAPEDGSHWLSLKVILEELHLRGHDITVVVPSGSSHIKRDASLYKTITVYTPSRQEIIDPYAASNIKTKLEHSSEWTKLLAEIEFLVSYSTWHFNMLNELCEDTRLMDDLVKAKYNLVLSDPLSGVGVYLGRRLGIPVVLEGILSWWDDPHNLLAPSPLSYVPVGLLQLSDKMTFAQRVENFIAFLASSVVLRYFNAVIDDQPVIQKYLGGSHKNLIELFQAADLWLMRTDFLLEFPRPTMPNVIYISGYHCKPSKPLSKELEDFVQSSGEHGVIIMTLGTLVLKLPERITDDIAAAFAQLPQKVIWKHTGKRPSTLGNNTLIVDWLPQNDLLGHPKTRVFVTHGGINGVQEAIYHGVPMIGLPLAMDQPENIFKMQVRGAAKEMHIGNVNKDNFLEGLKEVLYEPSYRENMKILSDLQKDQPIKPLDSAIFWIEYVMRHKGAPHLKSESYKMSFIQYYSLDVIAFLLLLCLPLSAISILAVRFLWQRVFCRSKVKKE